uniref:HAT C-terminal dimerisation domain-containing protein n=1 Tax=Lactuca sativa TaxID=4236 RepID=A0A9R1X1E8_LACSA|nr:hypothetical protein LSAT_V11C800403400 [Lactuca sativa]
MALGFGYWLNFDMKRPKLDTASAAVAPQDVELEESNDIDVVEIDVKIEGEEEAIKMERERWSEVWKFFTRLPISKDDREFALSQKSQLEMYLDEPRSDITEDINVLSFWKAHQYRYPELASMVRDILSIPVSTVASESAFSNGGRVLDKFRSSLAHKNVEDIICAKDWLFGISGDEELCLQDLTEDIMELDSKGSDTHEAME